jgi:hypothetical protein
MNWFTANKDPSTCDQRFLAAILVSVRTARRIRPASSCVPACSHLARPVHVTGWLRRPSVALAGGLAGGTQPFADRVP